MGIITTASFAKALMPGVRDWYGQEYSEHTPEWSDIYKFNTSRKAFEEDISTSSFGLAPVKTEGGSTYYASQEQGFIDRYTHVTYSIGFIITKEMYDDDQYDVAAKNRARGLAFSMRQTKETVAANILNRAVDSDYTFGDGKELCATDHPNKAGGTYKNELTTAADLSETSLEQAIIDLGDMTDDAGLKIAVRPKVLIVPNALGPEAGRILLSELQNDSANNAINVLRANKMIPGGYKVNHYLTDTDAWFIVTDIPNGMSYYERRADTFEADKSNDFDTDNAKYKASGRFSFGCSDKRGIFGSPGA